LTKYGKKETKLLNKKYFSEQCNRIFRRLESNLMKPIFRSIIIHSVSKSFQHDMYFDIHFLQQQKLKDVSLVEHEPDNANTKTSQCDIDQKAYRLCLKKDSKKERDSAIY